VCPEGVVCSAQAAPSGVFRGLVLIWLAQRALSLLLVLAVNHHHGFAHHAVIQRVREILHHTPPHIAVGNRRYARVEAQEPELPHNRFDKLIALAWRLTFVPFACLCLFLPCRLCNV